MPFPASCVALVLNCQDKMSAADEALRSRRQLAEPGPGRVPTTQRCQLREAKGKTGFEIKFMCTKRYYGILKICIDKLTSH